MYKKTGSENSHWKGGKKEFICPCGQKFFRWNSPSRQDKNFYCSKICFYKLSDKTRIREQGLKNKGRTLVGKNPRFKGWRISPDGYKLILMPSHPFNNGKYIREHRLVMEKYLGRYLKRGEVVHHKNHNRLDNRLENLELMTNSTLHMKTEFALARQHFRICKCKCHKDFI